MTDPAGPAPPLPRPPMTHVALPVGVAPRLGAGRQWWALTRRGISRIIRDGEVILAFLSPAFLALGFYLPLRDIMAQYAFVDYARFLMPIIALQSVGFVASSAAMRSCIDSSTGITTRFRTMPIPAPVPTLARLASNIVLLVISVICAAAASLATGWRPGGGLVNTLWLYGIVLGVGVGVAFAADAIGILADTPEATSQVIGLPLLILGMLSTGFMPITFFPDWIQPFARNQPISQFVKAMRAFDEGAPTADSVGPALWWLLALAICGVMLTVLAVRKARS